MTVVPSRFTGRITAGPGLVDESGLEIHGLDNRQWTRPEVPA
ncbi:MULTISPECIES: hypothetical protein [Rhodococcus]|nr:MULTISPECIES: hypothetical protein [Rhodococcus]AXY54584.1 hypothetical protein YT1_5195 [Rhodococcus ruber]MBP2213850.1 hypothetical protein [Rhodococcus ruber]WML62492.1 hypothetical protein QNA09_22070 [Rhodococcus sp. AH-ZY2]